MIKVLRQHYDAPIADSFRQAWQSETLAECPPLSHWRELLDRSPESPVVDVAIPATGFVLPTFKPEFKPIDEVASSSSSGVKTAAVSPSIHAKTDTNALSEFSKAMNSKSVQTSSGGNSWIWILVILVIIAVIILVAISSI
jgi:uncharacterized membrane protein YidH (DUF202 family)